MTDENLIVLENVVIPLRAYLREEDLVEGLERIFRAKAPLLLHSSEHHLRK